MKHSRPSVLYLCIILSSAFAFSSCRDMIHDIDEIASYCPTISSLSMIDVSDVENGGQTGLSPYRINRYETTYLLWDEVYQWAKENGYSFIKGGEAGESGFTGSGGEYIFLPVTSVHPADIIVWCNALSVKRGLEPCYYLDSGCTVPLVSAADIASEEYKDGNGGTNYVDSEGNSITVYDYTVYDFYRKKSASGYRLPSKAEWQYAAQGARRTAEDRSYRFSGSSTVEEVASLDKIRTPGRYKANGIGAFDMSGNVGENTFTSSSSGVDSELLNSSCLGNYGGHYNGNEKILSVTGSMTSLGGIISIYPYLFGFRLAQTITD